jgi:glycosyltransferase involved in cell wall biosynthesis
MTRASVIIAAYNAEASIGAAIASAQQQSERDIEILVIDDASTDSTYAEVERLAAADPRIRALSAGRNSGPGAARNFGLAHARGEWVAVLDADDRYHPERIATLCALGAYTGADLVADNLLLCPENEPDGDDLLIPRDKLAEGRWLGAVEYVVGNLGDGSRARRSLGYLKPVIRRDFLERTGLCYDETRFSEDFLFYVRCLLRGGVVVHYADGDVLLHSAGVVALCKCH